MNDSPAAGRLLKQLEELSVTRSFEVFAAFIRGGAVRRWVISELRMSEAEFTAMLVDLDNRRAEFLPVTIDDIAPRTKGRLRAVFELISVNLRKRIPQSLFWRIITKGGQSPDAEGQSPSSTEGQSLAVEGQSPEVPKEWKLRLPIPPERTELRKVSPTRLDVYLRCPFTYFLRQKEVLGDKRFDDRVMELARWEFGNLVHAALEAWGLSELSDGEDGGAIAEFLHRNVDTQIAERFGDAVPLPVVVQVEEAKRRLADFASVQAARRRSGWRMVAVEQKLELRCGHTMLYGKCDRIDFNEATGKWWVIDYKTWDTAEHAAACSPGPDGTRVWHSVQLPSYCAMFDACGDERFAAARLADISAGYCVLGDRNTGTVFTEGFDGGTVPEVMALVEKRLVPGIERGLFWPPSPRGEWRRDYGDWLFPDPSVTVDEDWISDQLARRAAVDVARGAIVV